MRKQSSVKQQSQSLSGQVHESLRAANQWQGRMRIGATNNPKAHSPKAVLDKKLIYIEGNSLPAILFCGAWTSAEDEAMAEAWLVLPAKDRAGRHLFHQFFNTQHQLPLEKMLGLATTAADLVIWDAAESLRDGWSSTAVEVRDLALWQVKAWRSLAPYDEGLAMIAANSYCEELAAMVRECLCVA